ncbi:MAG: hypothetical protein GWN14_05280 [candidate division Zixibacteria bacterium]|nr:hypothetical protein [candidate division Zixibacteria bacterium]
MRAAEFAASYPEEAFEATRKLNFADDKSIARNAAQKFDNVQRSFARNMHSVLDDLQAGHISAAGANKKMGPILQNAHQRSYSAGKEWMTGRKAVLNADDWAYLKRSVEYERGFLKGFIDDVVNGRGKMNYSTRMDMYAGTLQAPFNNASLEYSPEDAEVYWTLGIAEHCEDCLSLESFNPWTRASLPTVPGAGDTRCLGRCKCHLEYRKKEKGFLKKKVGEQLGRPDSMSKLFTLPPMPKGFTLPIASERAAIESMRQEMNYWRRAIQDAHIGGNKVAERQAIKMRAKVNQDLIDYLEKNKIWSPPALSVDEVLSGKMLDDRLMQDVFNQGLDGATVAGLPDDLRKEVVADLLKAGAAADATIAGTIDKK